MAKADSVGGHATEKTPPTGSVSGKNPLTSPTPPQGGSEFPLYLGRNDLQRGSDSNKVFVQAVRRERNIERYPADFMFRLTKPEYDDLRSQIVTSSWGGRRYPPYAFTEQGVAMLSSVLRSERAIRVMPCHFFGRQSSPRFECREPLRVYPFLVY